MLLSCCEVDELACSPDGAEESAGGGGEGRASSPAAQDCLQDPAIGTRPRNISSDRTLTD